MSQRGTRQQIVESADELFYRQGFEHTSFADIAQVVNISRGNFYHHFKTKDAILEAVIELRLDTTQQMLTDWEQQEAAPQGRIKCYINILLRNWTLIKEYGCPVGSLCNELVKLNHPLQPSARQVFSLFRGWLQEQFSLLGYPNNCDELAMNLLAWSQGVATLGSAFADHRYVTTEVNKRCDWVDSLAQGHFSERQ